MNIVHIASEIAKVAKVGGLGDVILGLSRELSEKGHAVQVILPKYTLLDYGAARDLHLVRPDLWSYFGQRWHHNSVWACWVEGIKVFLIEPHTDPDLYARDKIYGYSDDIERFTYFSRAALEFLLKEEMNPDIIHLHEWHTAICAPLFFEVFQPLGLDKPGIVFTTHNINYQGICKPEDLDRVGLDGNRLLSKMEDPAKKGAINLLKGGVVYANSVTTVSPTYADEIRTPAGGKNLHETFQALGNQFVGIRNGIDYTLWGPQVDPLLPVPYTSTDLDDKRAIKKELQKRLVLSQEDKPLVSSISRLVPQKGVHLIKEAIFRTLELGGQFILLGTTSIPEIREDFYNLKIHFSDHPDVHLELRHNEELVHLIYAGSDMFIVPSIFEPCGLTQLIALRYGTVPIVRRTGGLADTIFDVDHSGRPFEQCNGFTFDEPIYDALDSSLDRAFAYWRGNPSRWREIMINGMNMDYSWKQPAEEYLHIYRKTLEYRLLVGF